MLENSNENFDGYFEISYKPDGVYLTVHPPLAGGLKVNIKKVFERIKRKKIKDVDEKAVEEAVKNSNSTPLKIASAQKEELINAEVHISISSDKMKATVLLTPPEGGRLPTKMELISLLKKEGVSYGVKQEFIDNILDNPVFYQNHVVAVGEEPKTGNNGSLKYHFDINREFRPTILEDGSVNFRELNMIQCVSKGQVLCSLVPPTQGIDGITVTGEKLISSPGKPAVLPRGKNVEVSEDGLKLISLIDGQVSFVDGKVNIYANYEVPSDVGTSTGNIKFIGNVLVKGNVLAGFTVEAGGNVEVFGVVEGATIIAGGDIILRRGMQGNGKGHLKSGGNIIARYIEHSNIEAASDIKAEAILHSNIQCGNMIELLGRKGMLVGGSAKVGNEISAKIIGSPMATVTELQVGIDPTLRERYKVLKTEITNYERDIKKAAQALSLLKRLKDLGALTPDKEAMMIKSAKTKDYLSNKLIEDKEELYEIESKLQFEGYGKIRAKDVIYPGTKVIIGSCMMYVKENIPFCTLYRDGADIKIGSADMP